MFVRLDSLQRKAYRLNRISLTKIQKSTISVFPHELQADRFLSLSEPTDIATKSFGSKSNVSQTLQPQFFWIPLEANRLSVTHQKCCLYVGYFCILVLISVCSATQKEL